jgi:hypothetical protein
MIKIDEYRKAYAAELAKEAPSGPAKSMSAAPTRSDSSATLADHISQQLSVLRNAGEPEDARLEALRNVQTATFMGPRFDPYRAEFRDALRAVAGNDSDQLRAAALEELALHKDDFARDLLLKGLEAGAKLPFSIAKAVQLLGHDDHGAAVPIAHKILGGDYAVDAKEEAARVLASDAKAESLLSGILSDKKQPQSLRSVTASSLRVLNPQRFVDVASRIVSDDSEDDEVRVNCLNALDRATGPLAKIDSKLANVLTNIAKGTKSDALRNLADAYLRKRTQQ